MRDYAVIHSLWFDFESESGGFPGLAIPVDQFGFNEKVQPVDADKTLLDINVGDLVYIDQNVFSVTKVAIFRATPAPEVTSGQPVFEVRCGMDWLEKQNQNLNHEL